MDSTLVNTDAFAQADKAFDPGVAAGIVSASVTDPLWERMAESTDGWSYLSASFTSSIAGSLGHALAETRGPIEQALAEASSALTETRSEQAARESALVELNKSAQTAPVSEQPKIQEQIKALADRIAALKKQAAEEQARKDAAEAEGRAIDERSKDAEARGKDGDAYADRRGRDVFRGGEAP